MGSDASQEASEAYGTKRISVVTPYMPVADSQVRRFFTDCGYDIVKLKGLRVPSPVQSLMFRARTARRHQRGERPGCDAIIQVGTNLAMARLTGSPNSGSTSR